MRVRRSFGWLGLLFFLFPSIAHAEPAKCRAAALKAASSLAQARLVALQKCEASILKGKLGPSTDCTTEPKTAAALAKAEQAFRSTIAKSCGGKNKVCNAADSGADADDSLSAIGWGATALCPDLERSGCTMAIADCNGIAECLACASRSPIDRTVGLAYDGLVIGGSDPALTKCQAAIGKESAKVFRAVKKALQKCWTTASKSATGGTPCPDGDASGKTNAAILKARANLEKAICKACGGKNKQCGGGDDIAAASIGFGPACPVVAIPGKEACRGAITGVRDIAMCVGCVSTFKAACLDRLAAPWGGAYPGECNALCGDGAIDVGEQCDDDAGSMCPGTCRSDCTCPPVPTAVAPTVTPNTSPFPTPSPSPTPNPTTTSTPALGAPELDDGVATNVYDGTRFLYTGPNPAQTGVEDDALDAHRATLVRGRVLDAHEQPLGGVAIYVKDAPKLGQTTTRPDGGFDFVLNGGGSVTIEFRKEGWLPVQRGFNAGWQEMRVMDDVVMVVLDGRKTQVDLAGLTAIAVAQGNTVADDDGDRTATLMFTPGTQAIAKLPNGDERQLDTISVRATEYTVGPRGPAAMPGDLPPTSAYTYAVELSIDEALDANATTVRFTKPVPFYVENLAKMPVGTQVPVAFYDRQKSAWVPSKDGRVIAIVGETSGLADVDSTGDGAADDELDLDDDELRVLAERYEINDQLWRVAVEHFSPYDLNYGVSPVAGAVAPAIELPRRADTKQTNPTIVCRSSTIECENQVLRQSFPISGTPYSLNYRSDRVPGRTAGTSMSIPLSGATIPDVLEGIRLEIEIGGRKFVERFTAQPNLQHTFTWDRQDPYGRTMTGEQRARIRVGYEYPGFYNLPPAVARSFGLASGEPVPGDVPSREPVVLWQTADALFGDQQVAHGDLGGWSIDAHHSYDPTGRVLHEGGGRRRAVTAFGEATVTPLMVFPHVMDLALEPDLGMIFTTTAPSQIWHRDPDGSITVVAGTGWFGFSEDGPLTSTTQLFFPIGVTYAPDGSIVFVDAGSNRIRQIGTDGILRTLAGTGEAGFSGDGGPATSARISTSLAFNNVGGDVAFGPDGTMFFSDIVNRRVRRVGLDGTITTIAGTGEAGFSGDGGPATAARLRGPDGIAYAPDGSIYVADRLDHRVRRIGPDGIITTVAGTGVLGSTGDGGPASSARLSTPRFCALGPDGSLYVSTTFRVRKIAPDGTITTVAGAGNSALPVAGTPANRVGILPKGLVIGPDRNLYFIDSEVLLLSVGPALTGFTGGDSAIASEDGGLVYRFNAAGLHMDTRHALTGEPLVTFDYDSDGRLVSITSGDGNVTTIERDTAGTATGIVAPFGQRTALTHNASGYLASSGDPTGAKHHFMYESGGLLSEVEDPTGHSSSMTYDSDGRLLKDADAAQGYVALTRTEPSGDSFSVDVTTSLGHTITHTTETIATGDERHLTHHPDGTETTTFRQTDGTTTRTDPDQTETTTLVGPDPRFGLQAPRTTAYTLSSGGKTATLAHSRTVAQTTPGDPFTVTKLTDITTVNALPWQSVYTEEDKTFTQTSPVGRKSFLTIDDLGRAVRAERQGIQPLVAEYGTEGHDRGRLIRASTGSGPNTRALTFEYGPHQLPTAVTDALGRVSEFEHDAAGRITRQVRPDGGEILFEYGPDGSLVALTPPGRPAHRFEYTPAKLLAAYIPPDVGAGTNTTRYEYDVDHRLTQVIRPDGLTVGFAYDAAGRVAKRTTPEGETTYSYDPTTGKLVGIVSAEGESLSYSYTGGLLTQTTSAGTVAGIVGFSYDNDFRVISTTVNGANPIAHQYDSDGFLTKVGALTLARSQITGLLTGTQLGNVKDSYTYDAFGQVTSYSATFGTTVIFRNDLTYDKLGRITQRIETLQGAGATYDYSYDLAGRLEEVRKNGTTQRIYGYDDNGNRTHLNGAEIAHYDDQDRLLDYAGATFTYGAAGELASRAGANSALTEYVYDVVGNLRTVVLTSGETVTYAVDPANRRIEAKVGGEPARRFLWESRLRPAAELDGGNQVHSRFVYATALNAPDYIIKGSTQYRVIRDHIESPRLIVDVATGAIVQALAFDEFGRVLEDTNPGFQPFGYAGGLYTQSTSLVRLGARDYDATTGRWTSRDSIGFAGRSSNLFAYVSNEPIGRIDPTGTAAEARNEPIRRVSPIETATKAWGEIVDAYGTYFRAFRAFEAGQDLAVAFGTGLGTTLGGASIWELTPTNLEELTMSPARFAGGLLGVGLRNTAVRCLYSYCKDPLPYSSFPPQAPDCAPSTETYGPPDLRQVYVDIGRLGAGDPTAQLLP